MRSADIRQRFLDYFARNGHTVVPSASLLVDDPNLLFVNAGMVPFKPYFLGQEPPPFPRATSVQKCVRTQDIDNVGVTTRHNTFFQMAGNFSFGDYFKAAAIRFAWELSTSSVADGGYGLDADRIWVTVFDNDDEAIGIWREVAGLPDHRIQRRGMADNFWSMGVPGPCGPCSELYFDRGPEHGADGGPVADEDRYLEFWNLVFMQSERGAGEGKDNFPILGDLPAKNIDTGLGIERMALLLQGVDNVYETDLLRPVISVAEQLTGARYGENEQADIRLRVIADHTRTATMLIGDGVVPSNTERGYVLRRMIRRVVKHVQLLGCSEPAMEALVAVVRDQMGQSYPELISDFSRIATVASDEEQAFRQTLRGGSSHFDRFVADAAASGQSTLSGDAAFTLHDTYGFPLELTMELAADAGLSVDRAGFAELMAQQQRRSRDAEHKRSHADTSAYRDILERAGTSDFVGYDMMAAEARIVGLIPSTDGTAELILDRTPFYAEGGGQLADHGTIRLPDGTVLDVTDVQKPVGDLIAHRVRLPQGYEMPAGMEVLAEVSLERRRAISRSHTATHLIHEAMRRTLGDTATQAGSENSEGRLRFDFHASAGVPASVLADVEDEVNALLGADLPVRAFVTGIDEARAMGAMALFGEKYGERVRVVEVGEYTRELCGGTHAARSGQLGLVKILGEASIGTGVRRVQALVGLDAFRSLAKEHVLLDQVAATLKVPSDLVPERVAQIVDRLRAAERDLEKIRAKEVLSSAGDLAQAAADVAGVAVVSTAAPDDTTREDLRRLALDVRARLDGRPAVVVIAAQVDGKPAVVVAANPAAAERGLKAGAIVRELGAILGGGGGGRDDIAEAGGSKPDQIPAALERVPALVAEKAG